MFSTPRKRTGPSATASRNSPEPECPCRGIANEGAPVGSMIVHPGVTSTKGANDLIPSLLALFVHVGTSAARLRWGWRRNICLENDLLGSGRIEKHR